jgi:hypothetical protein
LRKGWIEAHGQWPNQTMAIVWRARAHDATAVGEHVASRLANGYNGFTPSAA